MSDWTVVEMRTCVHVDKRFSIKTLIEKFLSNKGIDVNVSVVYNKIIGNNVINDIRFVIPHVCEKLCSDIFELKNIMYKQGIGAKVDIRLTFC